MSGGVVRLDSDMAKKCVTCQNWVGDVAACIEDASSIDVKKIRILDAAAHTEGICELKHSKKRGTQICSHHIFRQ